MKSKGDDAEVAEEIKRARPRKRKRVEIVKITVTNPDGTTKEVDAKECTKCGEVKALADYGADKRNRSGKRSYCLMCANKYNQMYYKINPEKHRERMRKHYAANPGIYRKRDSHASPEKRREYRRKQYENNPEKERERARIYRSKNLEKVRAMYCKYNEVNRIIKREKACSYRQINREKIRKKERERYAANREKERERRRVYYESNRGMCIARVRKYQADNPDKHRAAEHRREAMKRALPSTWTAGDEALMFKCALTQSTEDVHVDHVIPLAWGHGGSYVGNMSPLSSTLNISKHDAHVYEWFEANRQRFELEQSRFDDIIAETASQNGLTPDEYRSYYDWCNDNRRSLDETQADNERYGYVVSSLELWREATGIQFPIRIPFDKKPSRRRRARKGRNVSDSIT